MRRFLLILFSALITLSSLSACINTNDEPITLTILMDGLQQGNQSGQENMIREAVGYYCKGQNITLEFEYLTTDYTERKTELQRLRTEIMSGKGPDIFILPTWETQLINGTDGELPRNEPLFKDMDDAMRNGIFLPLDDYIAESNQINLDEHIDIVMEAGRTEEGQVVLPYTFEYGIYVLDKAKMLDSETEYNNFDVISDSKDEKLKYLLGVFSEDWIHSVLPNYVDVDSESLIITETELFDALKTAASIFDESDEVYESVLSELIAGSVFDKEYLLFWNTVHDETYPLVIPNTDGGITATITSYIAINRNTEHPQEAFNVIAPMFSSEMQGVGGHIWVEAEDRNYTYSIESCTDIGAQRGIFTNKESYTEQDYYASWETLQNIHSRITSVRFMSEMDCMLYDAWSEVKYILYAGELDSVDLNAIAAELYSEWKMMVAE